MVFGASLAVATTNKVLVIPNIADGTKPNNRAIPPDANAPSSFEEPIKYAVDRRNRLRMVSGVVSCKMVVAITSGYLE